MKKPLSLILIAAFSLPFVACTDTPAGRGTVFHQTDESPRSSSGQRSHRYGDGGTHSPSESTASNSRKKKSTRSSTRDTRKRRSTPSDPDGIVKPRDLDPSPTRNEEPEIVSRTPDRSESKPMVEENKPEPTKPASTDVPYAEAVPGKYGLVYSPYVKDKKNGLVNVTDENDVPLPPGTEVEDPHTGKVFRVP